MRTILFLVLVLFSSFQLNAEEKKRPQVCLNMIVKNETKVIMRCLESVKPLIDYWVIVDTGSKDGTQKMIKEFMKDIPGELHERPWVNFAHNRNEALDLAKDKADYLLFIDADDKFDIAKNFVMPKLDKDAYYIKIKYSGMDYDRVQMIKTNLDWKWGGVVHEALMSNLSQNIGKLDGVTMVIVGGGDRSADPKKFEKDAAVLEKALKEEPDNRRYVFYLAQSYKDAQKLELALKTYQRRVDLGGWDQEVFWSLYEIGIINETLNKSEEIVSKSYFDAFKFRPTRAEPLYRLANYYRRKDNHLMGYLISQYALNIKQSDDGLFVEAWIYDYGIQFEYSISSYWVGKYEESYKACNQLLAKKSLPDDIRECVVKNMTFVVPKVAVKEADPKVKKAS